MDSAHSLDKWKDGLRLTDYVNLWVFNRASHDNINDGISDSKQSFGQNKATAQDISTLKSQLPVLLQPRITDSPMTLLAPSSKCLKDSAHLNSSHPNSSDLKNANQGRIYIDTRPITAVSSTQIREQLQALAHKTNKIPVADRQIASIASINAIISNTEFNPLAKWLNPAVYHYIIAHQLYSAAQFR